MLRTKSVRTPINRRADGLRILVTRFRGRGMPASRYDVWMPNLGPSERLLGAGQDRRISWAEFSKQYRNELFLDGPDRQAQPNHQESRPEIYAAPGEATRAAGPALAPAPAYRLME